MTELSKTQRETLLSGICYRANRFPRTQLHAKLHAADTAYHLANSRDELADSDPNKQDDTYSRFQELEEAIVRETAEAYHAYYANTYLATDKVFAMTSAAEKLADAQKFNTVMLDQQTRTNWKGNLSKFMLDVAKYNLGGIDAHWATQKSYDVALELGADGESKATTDNTAWSGNKITRIDMYNIIFDHTVDPDMLAEEGEFGGYIEHMTQTRLFKTIKKLKLDSEMTVYDQPAKDDTTWSVYDVTDNSQAAGLRYYGVTTEPLGAKGTNMNDSEGHTNWATAFGQSGSHQTETNRQYIVTKMYMRIIPSVYKFPHVGKATDENEEVWETWVLGGSHVLATKRLNNAHGYLPVLLGQPDADSLKYNSAGPAQVAIPYQKTAKQILDRMLAGADRAIRDRALYNPKYIDKDKINSAIPDAKIPIKAEAMPSSLRLADVYHSIPYTFDTTRLGMDLERTKQSGQRAAGINNSQAGQFQKGNRTLEEYSDVQQNAAGKQFLRALALEVGTITKLKRIIKLNTLQYQADATLYDPEQKKKIEVSRKELFQADTDFKLADGLIPTEHMLSPNVIQQVLSLIGTSPEAFQKYDVAGMVAYIIQQSLGVNLEQFNLANQQQPPGGPAPAPAPAPLPQQ